jgi:hypothetical protein
MLLDDPNLTSTLMTRLLFMEIMETKGMEVCAIQKKVLLKYEYKISYGNA